MTPVHPLLNEIISWKEAPRQDVLRRVQQQCVHLQADLDRLEQENAELKARKGKAA
jgi:hypothetical protein